MKRAFAIAVSLLALHAAARDIDDRIVLGQSAALTGPAAQLGKDMQLGATLYFDAVNAAGGVNGRKIVLRTLDDGYDPARAAANTRSLIDDGVFALFGYVGTPTSQAALPIFTEARVPFVGAFTGAEVLRHPVNRYVFNVRASYFDETEAIIQHLTSFGIEHIAVFYQNDGYGQAGLAGVERALGKRGSHVIAKATVERNTTDVGAAVAVLSKAGAQAVIMISAYKSCAAFIEQMKKAGASPTFWNVSVVGSKALAGELDADGRGVEISQVVPFPWDASIPVVKEYLRAMEAAKQEPGFGTLEGYIAAKVMVEGLRRTGRHLDREAFVRAMDALSNYDAGGFKVEYSPADHDGSHFVDLTIISRDRKFMH